ncbi:C-type lectin domain family 4 member K-like [Gigantopelta aegis]|uniref:C-type lectin domain family 4 member K-like n=1 Tax=Gigantopelta aegis TaxID=1735272 RepID=UPI001B88B6FD|nr:C-type lectin domain family 4 member K-like [Gigantopelta aegis]
MEVSVTCFWCLFLAFLLQTSETYSERTNSCDVMIDECIYNVQIRSTEICKKQSTSRRKRADSVTLERLENAPLTPKDFHQLSKKLIRITEQMSVRILRWWRKLDKKIDAMTGSSHQRRSLERNNGCPDHFVGLKNWPSCYLFSKFNTSWYNAKDFCMAFDSDLVAMGTVKEHFLLTFFIKNNLAINREAGWWTSGSFLGTTRQWMWTSQFYTKPFTFIKWGEGEPNEDGSQCMLLKAEDDHLWHDQICTRRFNFICEIQTKDSS